MKWLNEHTGWKKMEASIFWGEVAPNDHLIQLYESEDAFLDTLTGFVGTGINAGDSCIIAATPEHLTQLELRLEKVGIHTGHLISEDLYIPLHAAETLSSFMINNWPDESLFLASARALIKRARAKNRRVRAAGEMAPMLWGQGYKGAALQLEHLWNKVTGQEDLCLFCTYPRADFSKDIFEVSHMCAAHTKIIEGTERQLKEVSYRETGTLY
jgi:hypothetical protein